MALGWHGFVHVGPEIRSEIRSACGPSRLPMPMTEVFQSFKYADTEERQRDEIHWGCMTWEVKVDVLKSPKYSQVITMISDNQI